MEKYLKENNLEIRHAFSLAHIFEAGKPNHSICGRIFAGTVELGDYDAALCKLCKRVVKTRMEEKDGNRV